MSESTNLLGLIRISKCSTFRIMKEPRFMKELPEKKTIRYRGMSKFLEESDNSSDEHPDYVLTLQLLTSYLYHKLLRISKYPTKHFTVRGIFSPPESITACVRYIEDCKLKHSI